ncbi:hypothetical protein L6452_29647 [Arctium lappa]|uniref:Uncharacterized protein n=1 Tax=Arctium lappa TaxID=4217 RepID=A0ACB8ZHK8_ARCLA|nr:hypothetical protein L6452_29647 [Arctium lappa]
MVFGCTIEVSGKIWASVHHLDLRRDLRRDHGRSLKSVSVREPETVEKMEEAIKRVEKAIETAGKGWGKVIGVNGVSSK